MQVLPIDVVLNLHFLESKVCAIEFFYFRRLSCLLPLKPNPRLWHQLKENIHEIPKFVRCKNREKICTKENNDTRQYLHCLAICLCSWSCRDSLFLGKNIQDAIVQFLFFSKITSNSNLQNNSCSILRTRFTIGYQTAQVSALWTKLQKISY